MPAEPAQPFKTEKDYTNFLKEWIRTASGFDSGLHGNQGTKALTVKMIPQQMMPTATIEDNLFYSSIKLMPPLF
jgi:hypothetical protein